MTWRWDGARSPVLPNLAWLQALWASRSVVSFFLSFFLLFFSAYFIFLFHLFFSSFYSWGGVVLYCTVL